MKYILLFSIFVFCFVSVNAKHITGGEMIYRYAGPSSTPNAKYYRITLRLFRDEYCTGCAGMPASVSIGIFHNGSLALVGGYRTVNLSLTENLPINTLPACITNAPALNYSAGYYSFVTELPDNNEGYTATYQTCCRIDGIMNVPNSVGATYIAQIPGNDALGQFGTDNSPQFARGISVVCYNKPFTLDFSATDIDPNDSLVYSLCGAYNGGAANSASYSTPAPPFYNTINYTGGYSGSLPLGPQAFINPQTGIISGIAPDAGLYVVSVCIDVYRNNKRISKHRKDFIITVAPCDFAGAQLQPDYISCDGFSFNFENLNTSPLNNTFLWNFGDGATSTLASPVHTYSTAGVYTVKLVVNQGNSCSDSTSSQLRVFPGYFPGFTNNSPMCKDLPVSFFDATIANYGSVNSWKWDFGDPVRFDDASTIKNPSYTYTTPGSYLVTLTVTSDKGCNGIFLDTVKIVDKPQLTLTNDTLICSIDTLQLKAVSTSGGSVIWSPNYNISDINSFTPLVWPGVTTTYVATFSDNFGCAATKQVKVNVVDSVTLKAMNDTTICTSDAVTLIVSSDALQYKWTPTESLSNPTKQNPQAIPTANTVYTVKGYIGKCEASDEVFIKTIPYPIAGVSADTTVCFGDNAFLQATGGSVYTWTPSVYLSAANIPNPVVLKPNATIRYIVSVKDTLGCPKAVTNPVTVTVVKISADAGPSDTAIVINQPLQLTATGSLTYSWTPATWLNNPFISNPLAMPLDNIVYTVKVSNNAGCSATDTINVKLYKLSPDLLVPSGFTPDGDGLNDIFRPIAIGMRSITAFRVYNRWGQLMYATTSPGQGWNGKFKGNAQDAGTYVWHAEGIDYLNKRIQRKGYVVLIR